MSNSNSYSLPLVETLLQCWQLHAVGRAFHKECNKWKNIIPVTKMFEIRNGSTNVNKCWVKRKQMICNIPIN